MGDCHVKVGIWCDPHSEQKLGKTLALDRVAQHKRRKYGALPVEVGFNEDARRADSVDWDQRPIEFVPLPLEVVQMQPARLVVPFKEGALIGSVRVRRERLAEHRAEARRAACRLLKIADSDCPVYLLTPQLL